MSPTPSETLRQTLTRALGAAQIAVKLDAADQDTMAIVGAYQRSISLLEDVIRRHPLEDEAKELSAIVSLLVACNNKVHQNYAAVIVSRTR
jgi:hypothetical protein